MTEHISSVAPAIGHRHTANVATLTLPRDFSLRLCWKKSVIDWSSPGGYILGEAFDMELSARNLLFVVFSKFFDLFSFLNEFEPNISMCMAHWSFTLAFIN
ncbi:hypothetical protein H2248_006924 [Termitomyces sp. 'cryptogamus']|nr:hypothetical protein H2248_006924 [Termitomyces sp. 'cryptogamus']